MLFLDKNDLFTQMARQKEQQDLDKSKVHYTKEINELTKIKEGLVNDPATIEKYARENCLMKRDNEDLFLVSEKPDKVK
jgi:cell division protein DivIC